MARTYFSGTELEFPLKFTAYLLLGTIAITVLLYSGYAAARKKPQPQPQQYRFLQRCESGLTAEYKSTRRLPISEVCGPANYSDYDVVKDESDAAGAE